MISRATLSSVIQGLPKYRSMLAGNTAYEPSQFYQIASSTGGGTEITFNSIPQTYKHLHIRVTATCGLSYTPRIYFNGVTTAGAYYYDTFECYWQSSSGSTFNAYSNNSSAIYLFHGAGLSSLYPAVAYLDILDYANTSKKPVITGYTGKSTNSASGQWVIFGSGVYNTAGAVTSITFKIDGNSFTSGTNIALYGVKG